MSQFFPFDFRCGSCGPIGYSLMNSNSWWLRRLYRYSQAKISPQTQLQRHLIPCGKKYCTASYPSFALVRFYILLVFFPQFLLCDFPIRVWLSEQTGWNWLNMIIVQRLTRWGWLLKKDCLCNIIRRVWLLEDDWRSSTRRTYPYW